MKELEGVDGGADREVNRLEPLRNDYLTFDGLSALRLGFAILLLCMILLQNSLGIDIITKVKAS